MSKRFSRILLDWYHSKEQRNLPWKTDKNPYKIWVSEIILQQTRVAQGLPYYNKFIEAFPNVIALAEAKEDQVLKLWEGLGYYSRARNLHYTAKQIVSKKDGIFPDQYDEILKLKGIGPYTAAAISSFAFDLSYPVVDGNVLRLISRYYGVEKSIDESIGKKEIKALCEEAIKEENPADFNQAIMDFGALVCTPRNTKCTICPFQESCWAFAKKKVSALPKRTKKLKKRNRYFFYFFVEEKKKIILRKRKEKDIWQGLYELPLSEVSEKEFKQLSYTVPDTLRTKERVIHISETKKQILSHQNIYAKIIHLEGGAKNNNYKAILTTQIKDYAFPRILDRYLSELSDGS